MKWTAVVMHRLEVALTEGLAWATQTWHRRISEDEHVQEAANKVRQTVVLVAFTVMHLVGRAWFTFWAVWWFVMTFGRANLWRRSRGQ